MRLPERLSDFERQPGAPTPSVLVKTRQPTSPIPEFLDLFGEDSWRNVDAGEREVLPPGAPTIEILTVLSHSNHWRKQPIAEVSIRVGVIRPVFERRR